MQIYKHAHSRITYLNTKQNCFNIMFITSTLHQILLRNPYRYIIVVEKPERKIPFERPRSKWETDIKMDLKEIGYEDVDWIHLAHDWEQWRTLMNTVMNLWVP
jgi:hypothetical protein